MLSKPNPEDFITMYKLSIKTLGIVQFLYIKTMAHFLDFKDANEFLKDLSMDIQIPTKLPASFLTLPHTSKLCRNITWEMETKKPK